MSLSATALTFASQSVGTTSAPQSITLTNTGGAVLNINSILTSGDFAQTNNCGVTLAVGVICTINVAFSPTVAGARSASLTITDDAAGSPRTISLNGVGGATPLVTLNTATLIFATQSIGTTSAAKRILLSNIGSASLSISSIKASGDFAQTNNCGAGLGAGVSCSISVTFTPTTAGAHTGLVSITSNAPGSPHLGSQQHAAQPQTEREGYLAILALCLAAGAAATKATMRNSSSSLRCSVSDTA